MAKKQSQTQKRKVAIEKQNQQKQRRYQIIGLGALLLVVVVAIFSLMSNQDTPTNAEARKVAPEVGAEAPDIELVTNTGESLALSDFRGQPVAVMFMHTW